MEFSKAYIKSIVDTDGSVFVANKPGLMNYPSIEITTTSYNLANQIKDLLCSQGFRVAKIWKYKSKLSKRITYKIPLNGKDNLLNWVKEIGFSNPYKMKRALSYLKKWDEGDLNTRPHGLQPFKPTLKVVCSP